MSRWDEIINVFLVFLRLGVTSFGGPIAHLAHFHHTFVKRMKWLSEKQFADALALCQLLPGPTSSQLGMSVGMLRSGRWGAVAAWFGFTLPSAALMIAMAFGIGNLNSYAQGFLAQALKLSAVAVVAHALVSMARALCPDLMRSCLAFMVVLAAHFQNFPGAQVVFLLAGGFVGVWFYGKPQREEWGSLSEQVELQKPATQETLGLPFLILFASILMILPILVRQWDVPFVLLFEKMFRTGALVFGGGHVVLPLLVSEFSEGQWITRDVMLAGYGAAQAIPGPLFSVAGFVGAAAVHGTLGPGAALVAGGVSLAGIFMPSFLLLFGILPYWNKIKDSFRVRAALNGVNAVVVGLLAAVLVDPITTSLFSRVWDVVLVFLGFVLLQFGRWPSWAVVCLNALVGYALYRGIDLALA